MSPTSVIVAPDRGHIAELSLSLMLSQVQSAIEQRGVAHLALTGGSSATALYELLRSDPRARRLDGRRVHVWQGDERFVPTAHDDSNWRVALANWLDATEGPRIPTEQRHPLVADAIDAGESADTTAAAYASEIERVLPRRAGVPAFDVVFLGVGGDGHIMSVFPGSAALDAGAPWALAVPAPTHIEPHQPRVTLAPSLLPAAGLIVLMVPGAGKADVMRDILGSEWDPRRWPAQLARRPNAVWLLEPDSAAGLSAG